MDQQSFLCPGRDRSRVAQPKELLVSVGNRSHRATRKGLAQPPLTTSLFLTPTLSFSIVCKAPIAPSQPPSPPHSSQRQIFPLSPSSQPGTAPALGWESCPRLSSAQWGGQTGRPAPGSRAKPGFANQPHSTLTLVRVALVIFRHRWELPGLSHLRRFHSSSLSPLHHSNSGLFGCWMSVPTGLCRPEQGRGKAGGSRLHAPCAKQSLLN